MARLSESGSIQELREQAASCRSVARASKRSGAAEALIEIAVEYERKADAMEAAPKLQAS
ncbi:MAG: hypothetical protein JWO25_547 [Alphaproteobacteria bacterium]|nr:hypothetical protein [Alphaproteobacteria bacterium]MDB5722629.1 hypothetical protein [Alphaproteobacteria bacterium]